MAFTLRSPAFADGESIPATFTCDGTRRSPELTWSGAPTGTRSFALILHDPDAPRGDFTHWILFNIPDEAVRIPENREPDQVGEPASNDFQVPEYGAPCPPIGNSAHRYIFTLYALDIDLLPVRPTSFRQEVEEVMQGHILDTATLTGYYQRL